MDLGGSDNGAPVHVWIAMEFAISGGTHLLAMIEAEELSRSPCGATQTFAFIFLEAARAMELQCGSGTATAWTVRKGFSRDRVGRLNSAMVHRNA